MSDGERRASLRAKLSGALRFNRQLLLNAGSMMGTAVATAGFGVVFWILAARYFSKDTVGVASASTSAMNLIGFAATLGFGTLLMGQLSRGARRPGGLLSAALLVAAGVGAVIGLLFAVVAPLVAPNLDALRATPLAVVVFGVGVGLTALAFVLDQALIGMMRGGLQFSRNVVFSVVKLLALVPIAIALSDAGPGWIYGAWTFGIAASLLVLVRLRRHGEKSEARPDFGALHGLRSSALAHHLFNLGAKTPDLLVPILVVAFVSAEANASFYTAWMIAGFIFTVPWSLSTVVFAIGAGDRSRLAARFRFSIGASLAIGLLANLFLIFLASPVLHIFGASYAADATTPLQILALGVLGDTIKMHYISVHRVHDRIGPALPLVWIGTALEIGCAIAGANIDGITGVAIGWVAAVTLEGALMSPGVIAAMGGRGVVPDPDQVGPAEAEAIEVAPVEPL